MHRGGIVRETHTSASAEETLRSFSTLNGHFCVSRTVSELFNSRGGGGNSENAANKCRSIPSPGSDDLTAETSRDRRQNILKGCTPSLPILLWQNDHPAVPNVDQEQEMSIAQGKGILGNTMPVISHFYIR